MVDSHKINESIPKEKASTVDDAARELDALEEKWAKHYPSGMRLWRGQWDNFIPFFQLVPQIRTVVYITNAIES